MWKPAASRGEVVVLGDLVRRSPKPSTLIVMREPARPLQRALVLDHVVGELVDEQQLLRAGSSPRTIARVARGRALTSRGVDRADDLAGHARPGRRATRGRARGRRRARAASARGASPREEVGAAGLDVEQQQRLRLRARPAGSGRSPRRAGACGTSRRRPGAAGATVAMSSNAGSTGRVRRGVGARRACAAGAPPARAMPMPSAPSCVVLRRAVEGDDAVVGEHPPAAARQLRRRVRLGLRRAARRRRRPRRRRTRGLRAAMPRRAPRARGAASRRPLSTWGAARRGSFPGLRTVSLHAMAAIEEVGVVGAGFMGSGDRGVGARAGLRGRALRARRRRALDRSRARHRARRCERAVERGKLDRGRGARLLERIAWHDRPRRAARRGARRSRRSSRTRASRASCSRTLDAPLARRRDPRVQHVVDPDRPARLVDRAARARRSACTSSRPCR